MDFPLIFKTLEKAGFDTPRADRWDSDHVKCRTRTQKKKACRIGIREEDGAEFKKRKGKLLAFYRIENSQCFYNVVAALIGAMYCHKHVGDARGEWETWWKMYRERMGSEQQQDDEPKEQCLGKDTLEEDEISFEDQSPADEPLDTTKTTPSTHPSEVSVIDQSPAAERLDTTESKRSAHQSEGRDCSGEKSQEESYFAISHDDGYDSDASSVPSRSTRSEAFSEGCFSPEPSDNPSETPLTIPETNTPVSSRASKPNNTLNDETPTKRPAPHMEPASGAPTSELKTKGPIQSDVGVDGDNVDTTVNKPSEKKAKSQRQPMTPEYTDESLGQFSLWPDRNPVTNWKLLEIIEKPSGTRASEVGRVYILQNQTNRSYCKVGYTMRTLEKRAREQKCHDHDPGYGHEPGWSTDLFQGAYRVEALVKQDLVRQRLKITRCRRCQKGHNEWFMIDPVWLKMSILGWRDVVRSLYDDGAVSAVGKKILTQAYEVTPDRLTGTPNRLIKAEEYGSIATKNTSRKLDFRAHEHVEGPESPRSGSGKRDQESGGLSKPAARQSSSFEAPQPPFRSRVKLTKPLTAWAWDSALEMEWVPPFQELATLEVTGSEEDGLPTYFSQGTQTKGAYTLEEPPASISRRKTLPTQVHSKAKSAFQKFNIQPLKDKTNSTAPPPEKATLNRASTLKPSTQRRIGAFSFMGGKDEVDAGNKKTFDSFRRLIRASTFR